MLRYKNYKIIITLICGGLVVLLCFNDVSFLEVSILYDSQSYEFYCTAYNNYCFFYVYLFFLCTFYSMVVCLFFQKNVQNRLNVCFTNTCACKKASHMICRHHLTDMLNQRCIYLISVLLLTW